MTESKANAPEGMHTITPHIVVSDAAAAADWRVADLQLRGAGDESVDFARTIVSRGVSELEDVVKTT